MDIRKVSVFYRDPLIYVVYNGLVYISSHSSHTCEECDLIYECLYFSTSSTSLCNFIHNNYATLLNCFSFKKIGKLSLFLCIKFLNVQA